MDLKAQGLGFRVEGLGFMSFDVGLGLQDLRFRVIVPLK